VLELARAAEPELAGADQLRVLGRVDEEIDNVRATLEWAFEGGDVEVGAELAARLERYWWVRRKAEGLGWLERAIAEPDLSLERRAPLLAAAGGAAYFTGKLDQAIELFFEAIEVYRGLDDSAGTARALARAAPPLFVAGRIEEGARLVEEAVAINRDLGDTLGLIESLHILAGAAHRQGDRLRSIELVEESLGLARETNDLAWIRWNGISLADVLLEQGERARTENLAHEALDLSIRSGDDLAVLACLEILAISAAAAGDSRRAGLLWGAGERLALEIGNDTPWRDEREKKRERIGEPGLEFDLAVREGIRLTAAEAAELR
jgi:tetratricopeptide (TPR) repeat protein